MQQRTFVHACDCLLRPERQKRYKCSQLPLFDVQLQVIIIAWAGVRAEMSSGLNDDPKAGEPCRRAAHMHVVLGDSARSEGAAVRPQLLAPLHPVSSCTLAAVTLDQDSSSVDQTWRGGPPKIHCRSPPCRQYGGERPCGRNGFYRPQHAGPSSTSKTPNRHTQSLTCTELRRRL
jgi:hypothetical protein